MYISTFSHSPLTTGPAYPYSAPVHLYPGQYRNLWHTHTLRASGLPTVRPLSGHLCLSLTMFLPVTHYVTIRSSLPVFLLDFCSSCLLHPVPCTNIRTYIHTYIRTYVHTYIHTHIHTYIHIYIYTYNIHTYIHTHKHALFPKTRAPNTQVTSLGYVEETLDAWVDGIVASIERAHDSLAEGYALVSQGELEDSNINRSPTRYDERNYFP